MSNLFINQEYKNWLTDLKSRIKTSQIKAAISVNAELIALYCDIGERIVSLQKSASYGDSILLEISKDLRIEFPDMNGFSKTNLIYCRRFYLFYYQNNIKGQQLVDLLITDKKNEDLTHQIPWGHNMLILQKIKDYNEAIFYVQETITNNWSRSILEIQIETGLYKRQGKAITNFAITLPKPQSDLAIQLLKDPYNFDFLTLESNVQELELEKKLIQNITLFLLELGKGFAYMGRQFQLKVGTKNYKLDLLFYHVKLKCYINIELKTKEFEPEFIGKLNFYLTAIDAQIKDSSDSPTIGVLLCKTKDNLNVEFALKDVNKPIGVSEFSFNELPLVIQKSMPTVEELEQELSKFDNNNEI